MPALLSITVFSNVHGIRGLMLAWRVYVESCWCNDKPFHVHSAGVRESFQFDVQQTKRQRPSTASIRGIHPCHHMHV